jgi:hypothetical protein
MYVLLDICVDFSYSIGYSYSGKHVTNGHSEKLKKTYKYLIISLLTDNVYVFPYLSGYMVTAVTVTFFLQR